MKNTVRDITKLSNSRYKVVRDEAIIIGNMDDVKVNLIDVCRYLKLDPAEFLITDENGKSTRLRHRNPSVYTG
tara:strand:+ start:304 stop:522 length:219 start_codon:yes stop_codon:yes gene_type:complete